MSSSRIRVGIIGGAGYTGGELLAILLNHPQAEIVFVNSRSHAGQPITAVHHQLVGETDLCFAAEIDQHIDVLFLCLGHGEAKAFLTANAIPEAVRIIDLSQDFRLASDADFMGRSFVYGLPEFNKKAIRAAKNIANPGCFATAIQLGLLPLANSGQLNEVHTTGITGSTGAGQKLQATTQFSWRANNIQAYKSLAHQHLNEITQTVKSLQPINNPINFIPWRGDFTRGIYVTSYTHSSLSIGEAQQLFHSYYGDKHPFTIVCNEMIDMKQVINTNKCLLHLEKVENQLVIHTAIDNLIKGASGQAVQNMNLMFGLAEDMGLRLKSISF